MRASVLHFVRLVFRVIPETRLFSAKSCLLRLAGVRLGHNVRVCSSATVLGAGTLEIGDDTWVGHQVLVCSSSRVTIGRNVDIAPRVYIGTGTHDVERAAGNGPRRGFNEDVIVEDGAWLGAGCIILPGVTVGAQSVVAAGAVVTRNVARGTLVGGVPARVIRTL